MSKNKSFKSLTKGLTEGKLNEIHERDWIRARHRYEQDPTDFYNAYQYLYNHPANRRWTSGTKNWGPTHYSNFTSNLAVMVVKVDPKTNRIEDNTARNTKTQVWVEWGPWYEPREHGESDRFLTETPGYDGLPSHDPRVDTGGDTYEDAIVNLANNVYHLYGSRERIGNDEKLPKKKRK